MGKRHQSFDAESLLDPPADKRDDSLPVKYLAHRLGVGVSDVPMPATPIAGWSALAYFDAPANGQSKPVLVGKRPCAVFGTTNAGGKNHAHRIYVEPGGACKADLGKRADGHTRNPKKSAIGGDTAGCAVVWGRPRRAPHLILCEGIETGAAIALAFKDDIEAERVAVVAAISAVGVEAFQPPPATEHVTVAADRDEDKAPMSAGYKRGEKAARRFAQKRHENLVVDIALPGSPGESIDWLDVFRRDGAQAVVNGMETAVRVTPSEYEGNDDTAGPDGIDALADAKAIVLDLAAQAKTDKGAPFEPDALTALAVIRLLDPAHFQRLRDDLKQAGVAMRDFNREVRKHTCRATQGGALGGDSATDRAGMIYNVSKGAICRLKDTEEGLVTVPLCNFDARIVGEEVRDDGAEQVTVFVVEGEPQDGAPLPRAEVLADRFAAMIWVTANWGTRPVIYAGQGTKDHLRAAIQLLSGEVPRHTVFTHLGWRKIGDVWFFLHSGGAIGPVGPVGVIQVQTGDSNLTCYTLPEPPAGEELKTAIRASLSVLEVAPDVVTYPILAAVYRAPLGEAAVLDLSIFLAGATGTQKTELTALGQAHYGAGFNGGNLPGNWASTANSLEKQTFLVKDAVFVVDDFAPTGTTADVQRLHRDADRLLRGQGNRAGRGRLRPDGSMRHEYYPRGLVVASGEDLPRGQSLRARIFIVEVSKGDVDLALLTAAQDAAAQGRFAQAMAGYVRWLAPQIETLKASLPDHIRALRAEARRQPVIHDRTPDIAASLMVGFETFLNFARETGAINDDEGTTLWDRCWKTLLEVAKAQARFQAAEEPASRFLTLLGSAIASGQAHLANAENHEEPDDAANWGWQKRTYLVGGFEKVELQPKGSLVGWLDGKDVLLDPDAAFAAAQRLAHAQGGGLVITPQTLWKRMDEQGKLASRDTVRGRNAVRRTIAGKRRAVIHILAGTLSLISDPTGPTGPRPSDINGLGAGNLGRFSEAPEKPTHETGPQVLENANSGPDGPNGPEIEHNPPSAEEIISDGAAADFEGGEI